MAPTAKMKAKKSSKVVKPTVNTKRSTASTKNHRFQPFSERIAKLKIDPIRRRRNADDRDEVSEHTQSYFGKSLEDWKDSNLSQTFTTFAKEVTPFADSLAAVLYNEEKITTLLLKYIEKGDALALEPLLSLLSHFAHDLDTRFEKHFQRAVATVAAVAARHSDPAVVEWSFTSLAWLFKYLSRLLVPDLRQLYDLMAPYLGKEAQKPYIVRFAAESMSFLVRKAAAAYERNPEPLNIIVGRMLDDCINESTNASADLHRQGVMVLLTDAIKGVQNGVHSNGLAILQSMLNYIKQSSEDGVQASVEILIGTLTSLIHHTDAETFQPVQSMMIKQVSDLVELKQGSGISLGSRLIFTIAAVRKGTRISEWFSLMTALKSMLKEEQNLSKLDDEAQSSFLKALAVVMHSATVDEVHRALDIFELIRKGQWARHFLRFCDLFARLNNERFQSFVLPQLQRFIIEQWRGREEEILQLLPRLDVETQRLNLACSQDFQKDIIQQFQDLSKVCSGGTGLSLLASANMVLNALSCLELSEGAQNELNDILLSFVRTSLAADSWTDPQFDDFALGHCLSHLLRDTVHQDSVSELWPSLCQESDRFSGLPKFWSNISKWMQKYPPASTLLQGPHMTTLEGALLKSLSLPFHDIRQSSLEILQTLYRSRDLCVPTVLSIAATIESIPVSIESSRSISMAIRRLGPGYLSIGSDELMLKAVPAYCFGLMHIRLSQAWDDAATALVEMSKIKTGEEMITTLVQTWLEGPSKEIDPHEALHPATVLDIESSGFQVTSDFECSNHSKVAAICGQVFQHRDSGYPSVEQRFLTSHVRVSFVPTTARGQALRVLHKMPELAEKRSRMLTPVLLRWAGGSDDVVDPNGSARWTRKDQKAMLAVFALFANPRVIFKSAEVYNALLNLCANGDVEIQRSALDAIFAWKDPAVIEYKEQLSNLLDDARFRDELSVFLQDANDSLVRSEHCQNLMPILLRLLYGKAVSGKHVQGSRRKAIFVALSRYDEDTMDMFVDIALGSLGGVSCIDGQKFNDGSLSRLKVSLRQQLGMLNMIDDMLEILGSGVGPFAMKLLNGVLICTVAASRALENNSATEEQVEDKALRRSIRQSGFQCLVKIFTALQDSSLSNHAEVVVHELIAPRLENFSSENTQSISASLRLLAAWASSEKTAPYLIECNENLLTKVSELLRKPTARPEVTIFILQHILDNLMEHKAPIDLMQPYVPNFVRSIGTLLNQQPSKEVLDTGVSSFTRLAHHIKDVKDCHNVIEICTSLLQKPNKAVSPPTKTGLLKTILPLLEKYDNAFDSALYDGVCGLFSRLQHQDSRSLLSAVLFELCKTDVSLLESAHLCKDLNAVGLKLDEPDHARRESAFTKINERFKDLSRQQWQPIVHNCLFYIRDTDDMAIRADASRTLRRFVDAASSSQDDFKQLITSALLPGIEYGVKSPSELVRAEYVRVLGQLVEKFSEWAAISDMKVLTVGGDEEASFFSNALYLQQNRRLRALRRLSNDAVHISSSNITKFLMPLVEHFVFDQAAGDAAKTLADQAVTTLGALARCLTWSTFRATFKRYVGYLTSKEDHEKIVLRLLGVLVDALQQEAARHTQPSESSANRSEIIIRDFLPPLVAYVHHKDESTVDRRMPVAVTIAKLQLQLPESEFMARLPPLLTDICHVLRSRSQEARDQTRKTLTAIFTLVGPAYLGFILKELRSALQRGYQLHVLSFTVHSLLVQTIENYQPGDLDSSLSELTSIIMDDIFGITGQEKDAEEYKSGMKEVKSSKSFDTMELLARVTPVQSLGRLIQPIRALLSERLDSKMLQKIEDLLTRLRKGLDQNPAANSKGMLIFCHEIIRQVYAEQNAVSTSDKSIERKINRYIILSNTSNKSKGTADTTSETFKLVTFSLNLLRKVIRRHDDLMTPTNLAGFLPIAGDALVQGQEDVRLSALRFLSTVMKLPISDLEANAPVYMKEAVGVIKAAQSISEESSKAALEVITSILREKRSVEVKEKDIADTLTTLKTNIDEPDKQGIVYKFLRAVLARKIMASEIYGVMDEVGKVVVTNPDRNVRESARSAFLHFILEYPQGKDRWNKQAAFFVENLKYEHPAGRQSVMELLHQLLLKVEEDTISQLAFTLFVALVTVQASDADHSCRQMAGLLIAKLFERSKDEQLDEFIKLLDKWLQNEGSQAIQQAALQSWTVLLRTQELSGSRVKKLRDDIDRLVSDNGAPTSSDQKSHVAQRALETFEMIVSAYSSIAFEKTSIKIWRSMHAYLRADKIETREIAARLVAAYFSNAASTSSQTNAGLSTVPLHCSHGLKLDAEYMRKVCQASIRSMQAEPESFSETFSTLTVRNLTFLGRCFDANGLTWQAADENVSDSDEFEEKRQQRNELSALQYLFNRLSYVIRQEHLPTMQRAAAIKCQAALVNVVTSVPDLESVVQPLYVLTDPAIPQPPGEAHETLIEHARELLDHVQKKVGSETYMAALNLARSNTGARREERKSKRKFDAVSAPEKWAREKRKKYEVKKARMKAKGVEARGRRRGW